MKEIEQEIRKICTIYDKDYFKSRGEENANYSLTEEQFEKIFDLIKHQSGVHKEKHALQGKTLDWKEQLKKLMGYKTDEEMAVRMEFVSQDFRPFNTMCDFIEQNFVAKGEVEKIFKDIKIYKPISDNTLRKKMYIRVVNVKELLKDL